MSQISLKSISGITSITTPAGVDNRFSLYNFDSTERLVLDHSGNLNISGVSTFVGLATFGSGVGIADSIFHLEDTNTAIRFPANDTFTVETAGTERLRINSDGDVGVGTETAETPRGNRGLEVAGTTGAEIGDTAKSDC